MSFPDPVNEVAARTVAAGVAVAATVAVATGWTWLALPLAYGFIARTAAGPRFSPWARIATGIIVPRLGAATRPVPGPPKRFAQGIGAVLTVAASAAALSGADTVARTLLAMVAAAATLEAAFAFCLGCKLFGLLVRAGLLPDTVCAACADLSLRRPATVATAAAATTSASAATATAHASADAAMPTATAAAAATVTIDAGSVGHEQRSPSVERVG